MNSKFYIVEIVNRKRAVYTREISEFNYLVEVATRLEDTDNGYAMGCKANFYVKGIGLDRVFIGALPYISKDYVSVVNEVLNARNG